MVASRRSWTAVIALCVAAPVAAQDRALAERSVDIRVTDTGFAPAEIVVTKGERVRLVFTREGEHACSKALLMRDFLVWDPLPLHEAFVVTITPQQVGAFSFTCSPNEIRGVLKVED